MATLVSVGCGGGGGDSCDGLGGLSIACADWSDNGSSVDPEVQAQVDEFYNSLKQKSPFFNQNVVQTTEKYESLTGIYQTDHQSSNILIEPFYALSPKGYIVDEHNVVGNLFSEPNDHFSMIFLPSSFWEISITKAAGGEILEHARTSASFGFLSPPSINTYDEQVTYVSAGTDNQIWDGFDFLNGHDIDLNSNVLGTPLRPGIYWSPVEYSVEYSQDDGNLVVESVLMLELSQNGSVTAIEDEFEEQLAVGVNGTCKINGMIDGQPDNLTLDTNFVLDASIVFESCYYSNIYGSAKTILYPDSSYSTDVGSNANDSLSDIAIIKTVLIPFDNLTEFDLFISYSWPETGRGFKLVSGFSQEEYINIESVAPYFFELCNPDGTLSLQILEDDGYVCLYDPDEEMLVPIPR
jgi:hypothetical protein